MNSLKNNKKFDSLSFDEMTKIMGGKWVKKSETVYRCLNEDCSKVHIYTVTWEENSKNHVKRNKGTDPYKPPK
jgi:hypothetical protein